MNFLSGLAKSGQPKPTSDEPSNADNPGEKPTSNADLFASAKVVAEAAQAQFGNDPGSYDKAKASGAAADLLDAAEKYGKLDETQGAGKYVEQAEGYLRQYGAPAAADHKAPPAAAAETGEAIPAPKTTDTTEKTAATDTAAATETTDAEKPSGGAGDYIKKAEEVLEKPAGEGGEKKEGATEKEGGYGDLMRAAGGFLNK